VIHFTAWSKLLTTRDAPAVINAKARCWSKIAILAPVRGSLSKYCHTVWYGKTRMVWLPDGEEFDMFSCFDEYRRVTDRQTNGHLATT